MANSNIGYRNWTVAVYAVLPKGVSSMKLHRDLGIPRRGSCCTVSARRTTTEPFEGPRRMYVGGKAKNMSTARHRIQAGVAVPVAGVKDRATNKVAARGRTPRLRRLCRSSRRTPSRARRCSPTSTGRWPRSATVTPRWLIAPANGPTERRAPTASSRCGRCSAAATPAHMSRAHVDVNEFTGRHNIRPLDTEADGQRGVGMVTKRLRYDDLVAT